MRSLPLRFYRILIRLLPEGFRLQHEDEMVDLVRQELDSARRRGFVAFCATAMAITWDVVRHAPYEHWRRRHLPRPRERSMQSFLSDLRFAVRAFSRQKGATAMILLTLTLAVAVNSTVFALLDGLFFRPLAFPQPERLVYLNEEAPKWNLDYTGINYDDFLAWREHTTSFAAMGLFDETQFNVSDGTSAERIDGARITYDLPDALGLHPLLGRTFTKDEDRPDPPAVAVIGYGLWQSRFAGARDVVGRTIRINSVSTTIIGVMPPAAEFPGSVKLWTPLGEKPNQQGQSYAYDGVARLNPGVTIEAAHTDLDQAQDIIWRQRDSSHVVVPRIMPLREKYVGQMRVMGRTLGAAVVLVLLIACVNVAGAMLARSVFRRAEMGIRMALGASGRRVARQMLTESLLLAMVAGIAGMALGWWGLRLLVASAPNELPAWARFTLDARSLGFAVSVVLVTAILFGLVPALQARRLDLRAALSSVGTRTTASVPQRRLLDALVAIEVALAAVLLVGGGLLVRGYRNLTSVETGFRVDGVAGFGVALPKVKYADGFAQRAFFESVQERLKALPGVVAAGAISCPPLTCHWGGFMEAEGQPPLAAGQPDPVILFRVASGSYFAAMGTPLVHGRFYRDREGDPDGFMPIVVNQSFVRRFWPTGTDPIGKRVRFRGDTAAHWRTVVGVTTDERHYGLDQPPRPGVYIPLEAIRKTDDVNSMRFTVYTHGDPATLLGSMRHAIQELDPELPVYDPGTMRDKLDKSLVRQRTLVGALTLFAALALLLAVSGVYAVVSYVVGRRRHELGIRMALGAQQAQVLGLVLRHGLRVVAIGLVIGIPAALASSRILSTLLVGITQRDPVTYLLVVAVLIATGVAAALVPARRAATMAPTSVLSDAT